MSVELKLHSKIEALAPIWIKYIQKLVKIPSYSGDEYKAQEFVASTMKEQGIFHDYIYYNDKANTYCERNYSERPNVVGLLKGKSQYNFILNAHIDTVPIEDETSWTLPPFGGEIREGKLFGRGALDDKAGIAMMLMIAQAFLETDIKLPFNLYLESVIEDEDTGNGTKACLDAGICADAAIVIDGTWPFRIIDAHLGQVWIEFDIEGVPVASCSHERGVNPINIASQLLLRLSNLIERDNIVCGGWYNINKPYFVSPGVISAGKYPGAVPERCKLICQLGFPSPGTVNSICVKIDLLIRELMKEGKHIKYNIKGLVTNPFENRNNSLVQLLMKNIKRLRVGGMDPINVAVTGHCGLRNLKKKNGKMADACLYGPGGGGNPHVKDEYFLIEHFVPVAQNIVSTICEWNPEI